MAKFSAVLLASLAASASAFVQQSALSQTSALQATGYEEVGGVPFDPLSLAKLGTGESFDTFPNMFPDVQFLQEAEIKHGRQAMLAWTGVWATHEVRINDRIKVSRLLLRSNAPKSTPLCAKIALTCCVCECFSIFLAIVRYFSKFIPGSHLLICLLEI
jgi:hypothetical protein